MIATVFQSARVCARLQSSVLGLPVYEALMSYLLERRYQLTTIQQYVQNIEHFDRWLRRTRRPLSEIEETLVKAFIDRHLARCRCSPPACTTRPQIHASLQHLLRILRDREVIRPEQQVENVSPGAVLLQEFVAFLRDVRGAAPSTTKYYARYASEFLTAHFDGAEVNMRGIVPADVTRFLTGRRSRWGIGSTKAACTGLRSFFRFLQVTGRCDGRLVQAVPRMPLWRLSTIPRVLSDDLLALTTKRGNLNLPPYDFEYRSIPALSSLMWISATRAPSWSTRRSTANGTNPIFAYSKRPAMLRLKQEMRTSWARC